MIATPNRLLDRLPEGVASMRPGVALVAFICTCTFAIAALPVSAAVRSVWIAPLVEETVLRLGVQDGLSHRFPAAAPALAALGFAAAHMPFARTPMELLQAAATALPAGWIGFVYRRTRRLGPCIAWHAVFNLAWLGGLASAFARAAAI
jgi:membrane protease YdiL (CAAX protease family)